jgi:hypothetical protein
MMIANVLAFRLSPKRSPATLRRSGNEELVISYNAHFALGRNDKRRLALPSGVNKKIGDASAAQSRPKNKKCGTLEAARKRPRGG